MIDAQKQIADLEAEIEALSDAAERCRKSLILAKGAIVCGALLLVASLLGLNRSGPMLMISGIAAILAGIGFFGSSRSTLDEIREKITACEQRRSAMIDGLSLRDIPSPSPIW